MAWPVAVLVVDGLGAGLHRLLLATGAGRWEQVVVGEPGRAAPARLALADVLVDVPVEGPVCGPVEGGQRSRAASREVIVAALGFPMSSSPRARA
ncbi:hypothetical protein AB0I60_14340 [Actinosynnema sp. NPDC050436]|uniref:hypothetical protein n=1 Tax=Actinosynnema sp. NPDC050436 TaxID=3155659 RepID=UPI0033FBE796